MPKLVCVRDFEKHAKEKLPRSTYEFISAGGYDEQTKNDNLKAFHRYKLRPKVLTGVSDVDLSSSVLGSKIDFPVCIGPTAYSEIIHPDGTIALCKAAHSMGVGYTLSTWATRSIEDLACAAPGTLRWFQLAMYRNRKLSKNMVERAERNGYKAIFFTVDVPVRGRKYNEMSSDFRLPSGLSMMNFKGFHTSEEILTDYTLLDARIKWSDMAWLRSITKLPIVIKGILTAEMAEEAVKHGADGIVVSNHGGRQLDCAPATIDALSEVVKAVNGRCEIYFDSGVRTGQDVLKAIALGARAVFIGRPSLWGLACKGEEGVREVLQILRYDFKTTMQLMGCKSIEELQKGKNLVVHQSYYAKSSL